MDEQESLKSEVLIWFLRLCPYSHKRTGDNKPCSHELNRLI